MTDRLPPGSVAIIGPGRVGTAVAAGLIRAGHRVVACGGGSEASGAAFTGRFAGARAHTDPVDAARGADLVVVATPDDATEAVASAIAVADAVHEGQRFVHVAGSLGLAALERPALAGARTAACHPAQTVPEVTGDPDVLVGAAWAVTARPADLGWASDLVEQLGGTPHHLADDSRLLYHAGLAVGSNAVGAVITVARRLLRAAGVDDPATFLGPLVAASAANAQHRGAEALTGPVVRGDAGTITRHLGALAEDVPELAEAYRALSRIIFDQVRPVLDDAAVAAIEAALQEGPP